MLCLTACVDEYDVTIPMPDKPSDVANQEYLNSFDVLKSYITRDGDSPFKLSTYISPATFLNKAAEYSVVVNNFEGIDVYNAYTPSEMMSDGEYDFSEVKSLGTTAEEAGLRVCGGVLASYDKQPAAYLNELIKTDTIYSSTITTRDIVEDFDSDSNGKQYSSVDGGPSASVTTDPIDSDNKVLHISNSGSSYSFPVMSVSLPNGLTLGDYDSMGFDVYLSTAPSSGEFRLYIIAPSGTRYQYNFDAASSLVGTTVSTWQRYCSINLKSESTHFTPYGILLPSELADLTSFDIALGVADGIDYYIDNVTFNYEISSTGQCTVTSFTEADIDTHYPLLYYGTELGTYDVKVVDNPTGGAGQALQVFSTPQNVDAHYMLPVFEVNLPTGKSVGDMLELSFDLNCYMYKGNNYVDDLVDEYVAEHSGVGTDVLNNSSYSSIVYYILPTDWDLTKDPSAYRCSTGKVTNDYINGSKNAWFTCTVDLPGTITSASNSSQMKGYTKFLLAIGQENTQSFCHIKNIVFAWSAGEEYQIYPKTDAEKKSILTAELDKWVGGMVEAAGDNVVCWDVIADPNKADTSNGYFDWAEYLGVDGYGQTAIRKARESTEGTLDLFVSTTLYQGDDMVGTIDQLATLVSEWEGSSADGMTVVDGYDVRLNAIYSENATTQTSNEEAITALFTRLAQTGKKVRLSSLGVMAEDSSGNFVTSGKILTAQRERAADYLAFIIKEYRRLISSANQYGISIADMTDTDGSSVLCPWSEDFNRTETYEGIVNGLKADLTNW